MLWQLSRIDNDGLQSGSTRSGNLNDRLWPSPDLHLNHIPPTRTAGWLNKLPLRASSIHASHRQPPLHSCSTDLRNRWRRFNGRYGEATQSWLSLRFGLRQALNAKFQRNLTAANTILPGFGAPTASKPPSIPKNSHFSFWLALDFAFIFRILIKQ